MRLIRLAVTSSTQEIARPLPISTCVVADHQTVGRGRRDRRWEAPPGVALLASFVLPMRRLALYAAGVGAVEACGPPVRLKWPNDLLLNGAKLGGLLAEQHDQRCVIGIGINLTWAPPGGAKLDIERDTLLNRLCERLPRWFEASDEEILAAWRRHSDTLGRMVKVESDSGSFEGRAEDITPDGSLIVGERSVTVEDVVHLCPNC
jgi:BirA family transcriptional regulator, biotin operon repressor / biotin---[acetyl-CoA-carboxylase] ligase